MIVAVKRVSSIFIVAFLVTLGGCYRSYDRRADDDVTTDPDVLADTILDPDLEEGFEECHDRVFDVSQGHPAVLILMDRSNSMAEDYWRPARDAVEGILDQWDDQIAFGLAVFPGRLCSYGAFMCLPTTSVDVHPGLGTSSSVHDALSDACCCGGTPLAESLDYVGRYLAGRTDGLTYHVLLVTDGGPNCNTSLNRFSCVCTSDTCSTYDTDSLNCLDNVRAVDSAAALKASGFDVHVLGISAAAVEWSWVMDDLAEAGGTGEAVLAEQPDAIRAAVEGMAGDVAPCRFQLLPGEVVDPANTHFYVDGELVPHDPTHTDGWDWVDLWTVDFHGPACDMIVEGGVTTVTARVNCED
jgi:hypothetical protein